MAMGEEQDRERNGPVKHKTRVLNVDISKIASFEFSSQSHSFLEDWNVKLDETSPDTTHLLEAVKHLQETSIPVAFPTETVYGLGADATRSAAIRGIYEAKQRPVDNPLIVHICSLTQLRSLLQPPIPFVNQTNEQTNGFVESIPAIYQPLIQRFWPGPLTILLPNPPNSVLAPEVTAGLPTFGARMPSSLLALTLIKIANVPLAAPSANASTKPSPTTAQHVKYDLNGRIDIVLDGGPCDVGVESTVVDGLSDPPLILRPGGVSIGQVRECPGWETTIIGYKDGAQVGKAPRAPGMKYRHYSPQAKVVLVEADIGGNGRLAQSVILPHVANSAISSIGMIRTKRWRRLDDEYEQEIRRPDLSHPRTGVVTYSRSLTNGESSSYDALNMSPDAVHFIYHLIPPSLPSHTITVWDIHIGHSTADIARGLFSALRELDQKGVDVIFVEGIDDTEGDTTAAVMNRLRKAAEIEIKAQA
ncbi:hypothetical protein MMC19_000094 [Ptychographa xylographoides]|nr:hypothetical protein [Ptychographa xylographoides]